MYYKVIDNSGSLEMCKGKLISGTAFSSQDKRQEALNKWVLLEEGWNYPAYKETFNTYYNDVMLVNFFDKDRYLFIEKRFLLVIEERCTCCGQIIKS